MVRQSKARVASSNDESVSDFCRRTVKEKILHSKNVPLLGRDFEFSELYNLVLRTVERGESNSALIIGPRGTGKSTLVAKVLEEAEKISPSFKDTIVVQLDGDVHTDDRLSLKGITAQMKLENCVGDKVFGSFAENLTFLLQCLSVGNQKKSKSVIFVLDEFDLFCHHRNQTLLYNLFDIAQSAQAPICVLGISCRSDVTVLFEKRVLSRFSNRKIHLHPSVEGNEEEVIARRKKLMGLLLTVPNKENCPLKSEWNSAVEELCGDIIVEDCLKNLIETSQCESTYRNFLFLVVSKVSDSHPVLKPNDFQDALDQMNTSVSIKMIEGLSALELSLMISMKHQWEIYEGNPFNFEMIVKRYINFSHTHTMMTVDRQVLLKAFENLKRLELIRPVASGTGQILKEFQLFELLATPSDIREAVKNYVGLPTDIQQWAMSDLT